MIKLGNNPEYSKVGNNMTMGQPSIIEDKANDSISPSKMRSGQTRNQTGVQRVLQLWDSSSGGHGSVGGFANNQVSGLTAQLKFTRGSDETKSFIVQKRAGYDLDINNILELFATAPDVGAGNYIFIGREGSGDSRYVGDITNSVNIDTTQTYSILNGSFNVDISTNNGAASVAQFIGDARTALGSSLKSGVISYMVGSGTDGFGGLGYGTNILIYVDSTGLRLGGDLIPDASGYNIGTALHKVAVHGTIVACPLPVTKDALTKLSLTTHKKLAPGVGHFGDDCEYLDIPEAPEEMKTILKDKSTDIEIVRTTGFLYSCIKELNEKVKNLEAKLTVV